MDRLVVGLFCAALTAPALAQSPLSEKDLAAIRSSTEAFANKVVAADFSGVAALYTENADLAPPNQAAVQGRVAIEAWMKAFPPVKELNFKIVSVEGRGDLAYVRGTYAMTLTPPGAAAPVKDQGKYIEVRRKAKDGSWKIAHDIFNSDLPAGH